MTPAEYVTTDFFLSAFLVHKGATLLGLRRLGPKKVEFRFETGESLHALLRLFWSGHVVPVIPWELFLCYHRLKCLSIDRYDPPLDGRPANPPSLSSSPATDADQ
jgi:hypothetical protein